MSQLLPDWDYMSFSAEKKEKPSRWSNKEDLDKMHSLLMSARERGHSVILVRKDLEAYAITSEVRPPERYDQERYGRDSVDFDKIFSDFVIVNWHFREGKFEIANTLAGDDVLWPIHFPMFGIDDPTEGVISEIGPHSLIDKQAAFSWRKGLSGTVLGELYEAFLPIPSHLEIDHVPFNLLSEWAEEEAFTLEQKKQWLKMGVPLLEEAYELYEAGLEPEESGLLSESGKTIGELLMLNEISYDEAFAFIGGKDFALNKIYTLDEAAFKWGIDREKIEADMKEEREWKRAFHLGHVRKADNTCLVKEKVMRSIYGDPK